VYAELLQRRRRKHDEEKHKARFASKNAKSMSTVSPFLFANKDVANPYTPRIMVEQHLYRHAGGGSMI
jgi:hypothetical protein